MKTNTLVLAALAACVLLSRVASTTSAQTFQVLHSFPTAEGFLPTGSLVFSGGNLYGSASGSNGMIFRFNVDTREFTNLHSFVGTDGSSPNGLMVVGGTLYGTTVGGGAFNNGTVFRMNLDGSGFTNLHNFSAGSGSWPSITNSDGTDPVDLVISGSTLFGVAYSGGMFGGGTVFAMGTNGMGFTNLHSFRLQDGTSPNSLVISGQMLYGTAYYGGATNATGTVFALSTDGSRFSTLHVFRVQMDGGYPRGPLTLSGHTLYGTTASGGSLPGQGWGPRSGSGTVFQIDLDGTSFATLHTLDASYQYEGSSPQCELVLWGNTLYGTTHDQPLGFWGSIFALEVDGSNYQTLYRFAGGSDGKFPQGDFILWGNRLFGVALAGAGLGVIYEFDINTALSVANYGDTLILSWPTNPSGFTLQSATNLLSPTWTDVPATPAVLNNQNTVLRPRLDGPEFFRLHQ